MFSAFRTETFKQSILPQVNGLIALLVIRHDKWNDVSDKSCKLL